MEEIAMIPMLRDRSAMPRFVDEFFVNEQLGRFLNESENATIPQANIREGKEGFAIEVAAPGFDKQDFRVNLNNNALEISSEREEKGNEEYENVTRREFRYSSFRRTFTLPKSADTDRIEATYRNGILSVSIPKREEAKAKPARQIAVS